MDNQLIITIQAEMNHGKIKEGILITHELSESDRNAAINYHVDRFRNKLRQFIEENRI